MNSKKSFSTKIDLSLKDKLKKDLEEKGFSFKTPPYTIFSAKKNKIIVTLYESGSLLVQGKEKDEFIEFYLEPEILKSFEYTHPEINIDMNSRIGVDESGKGDFFGPLCICSLFATKKEIEALIKLHVQDSKKLSDKKILKTAEEIQKLCKYSTVILYPEKYNELYEKFKNLNLLLGWGHATAIYNLHVKTSCKNVIIDQFAKKSIVSSFVAKKNIKIDLKQQHKAETDIVVAAASILARAYFVKGLEKLEQEINIKLPKGASKQVKTAGIKIKEKLGVKVFDKIAKKHFKTYKEILS